MYEMNFSLAFLVAAARIKKREDQLTHTKKRNLPTPVAKCNEVDGGIFEHLS
jgi:hypothetical protein